MYSPIPLHHLGRFWANVQRCAHGPLCLYCCWDWTGGRKPLPWDYGMFNTIIDGKRRPERAHRITWELLNQQPFPSGRWGCHYCNRPPCANWLHIYAGTAKDNTQDAVKRGTLLGRYRGIPAHGEQMPHAKLTDADIPIIRQLYLEGHSQRSIAARFQINYATIFYIIHGKTWKHVPHNGSHDLDITRLSNTLGSMNKKAKLTEDAVRLIRILFTEGILMADLARQFEVDFSVISRVVKRQSWKHVA